MSNNSNKKISKFENFKNMNSDTDNKYEEHLSTKEEEMNKLDNNNLNKDPIYIMTLELEKGKPEKIKIYSDSDPMQIASNFCKEHNLDYNGLDYLRNKIEALLNQNNINLISKNKEKINNSYKSDNYLKNNNINDYNDRKKYDLTSTKQNTKNKINNFNKGRNFNLNNKLSSKKGLKCKARIQSNQNSDKIFDKIYSEIKYKNNQNENKYNIKTNDNININNLDIRNNNVINNYNEYKDIRNEKKKLEREKQI